MSKTPSTAEDRLVAADIAIQARQLREHHPELYEHLAQRDRAIKLALAQTMKNLAPGIGDLSELAIQEPIAHLGLTEEAIIEG